MTAPPGHLAPAPLWSSCYRRVTAPGASRPSAGQSRAPAQTWGSQRREAEAPARGVAFLGSTSMDGKEKQARTDHKAHSTTSLSKKFLFPQFHTLRIYANLKQSWQEKCWQQVQKSSMTLRQDEPCQTLPAATAAEPASHFPAAFICVGQNSACSRPSASVLSACLHDHHGVNSALGTQRARRIPRGHRRGTGAQSAWTGLCRKMLV